MHGNVCNVLVMELPITGNSSTYMMGNFSVKENKFLDAYLDLDYPPESNQLFPVQAC